jgi:hypothetical protein
MRRLIGRRCGRSLTNAVQEGIDERVDSAVRFIEWQPAGGTDAPDLAGNAFLKRWTDRSVGSLVTFVESQMPVGRRPHLICRRGPSLKETGDFKINNSGRRDEGVLARGESFHLGRHDWGHC